MASHSHIPQLGLGTFGRTGDAGIAAIETALDIGYRHLDTAQSYDTERTVGEAFRRSGLARDAVFITTKVADTNLAAADFMPSVRRSLDTIGVDQVDLLLIHWPVPEDVVAFESYMQALKQAQDDGHARLIGVSNFTIEHLERAAKLLGQGALATNQVEIHPWLQVPILRDYARSAGLQLTAYQPLVKGQVAEDEVLKAIAATLGTTPAAVALAFLMAEGHIVIPASSSRGNLENNFRATAVSLSGEQMDAIRGRNRGYRHINPAKSPRWDD
ncbi:aldo/keto reductase [Devosia chinhatensis]|uniref:Aldo/keto reductase n=1 Tax=Devosia chinhatensis TaxID=429727 RepID=A0A0F5FIY5_9HYPH|nr:aldo/keto reductase [Devosia chinhatensis]KKB08864.1 aldo/keto reductase [Devosia chinhatensis]